MPYGAARTARYESMRIGPYEGRPDVRRLIAAMRGEPTDRVPNFEILIEDQHVEEAAA